MNRTLNTMLDKFTLNLWKVSDEFLGQDKTLCHTSHKIYFSIWQFFHRKCYNMDDARNLGYLVCINLLALRTGRKIYRKLTFSIACKCSICELCSFFNAVIVALTNCSSAPCLCIHFGWPLRKGEEYLLAPKRLKVT